MKLVALVLAMSACTSGMRWGTAIGGTLVVDGVALHETVGFDPTTYQCVGFTGEVCTP
ncbi:MAG: hypothetical protein QM831_16380 [Kofleriaceae bacterium]